MIFLVTSCYKNRLSEIRSPPIDQPERSQPDIRRVSASFASWRRD